MSGVYVGLIPGRFPQFHFTKLHVPVTFNANVVVSSFVVSFVPVASGAASRFSNFSASSRRGRRKNEGQNLRVNPWL